MPAFRQDPRLRRALPLLYALLALAFTSLLPMAFTPQHDFPTGYFLRQFMLASFALAFAGLAWLPRWPGAPWLALLGILLAAAQVGEFMGWVAATGYHGETRGLDFYALSTWNPLALGAVSLGIALQGALLLRDARTPA